MSLLAVLFRDDTRVRILQELIQSPEGLHQRTLATRTGRSPSHVNKVVHAFFALELVHFTKEKRVRLDPESPLHDSVVETVNRFQALEGQGRLLRTILRAARKRFQDRFYVGGYRAATRELEPIDFTSDRVDLFVKGLTPKDREWAKSIAAASPYALRLHPAHSIKGYVEQQEETLDEVPCYVAFGEIGLLQCLDDTSFPIYGAFLLLVQGIAEREKGAGGYHTERLTSAAVSDKWDGEKMQGLIDYIEIALKRDPGPPPAFLAPEEARELRNALDTVVGF